MRRPVSSVLLQTWRTHGSLLRWTVPIADPAQDGGMLILSRHGAGGANAPILELVKVTAFSILEVVLLSLVGYIMARRGVIDKKTQTKINKLNVSIFTPALLFSKVAFSLNAGRLAELAVVPIGFVAVSLVGALSAYLLARAAGIKRSQRNFAIACAISPNSNSLPVALMQSLVATVPMLHWEEDDEPEDTVDGMLGRALTYLVLFSTLGMFLRWSVGAKLLSTMETEDERPSAPPTGQLIDHPQTTDASVEPRVNGGSRPQRKRTGVEGWAVSFPNSPVDSEDEDEAVSAASAQQRTGGLQSLTSSASRFLRRFVLAPLRAINNFMTAPLWAAILSLTVAVIPPLQAFIGSLDPVVGALETAGGCSIPLTMIILGAYFHSEDSDASKKAEPERSASTQQAAAVQITGSFSLSQPVSEPDELEWSGNRSTEADVPDSASQRWRLGAFNPWSSGGSARDTQSVRDPEETAAESGENAPLLSSAAPASVQSAASRHRAAEQKKENWTIAVAIASRMLVTPIVLVPLIAWYAIDTKYNVVDDPVFIASACLIVGSPPALTLAQITSQSATGNSGFERLISKTIFIAYTFLAAPTTIILVLIALVIAEND